MRYPLETRGIQLSTLSGVHIGTVHLNLTMSIVQPNVNIATLHSNVTMSTEDSRMTIGTVPFHGGGRRK